MTRATNLTFRKIHHDEAHSHLFPGDRREAAVILICSRAPGPRMRLLVREVVKIPHEECEIRERDALVWPGQWIETALDKAEGQNYSLILMHSHPGGLFAFSDADDRSDEIVIPCLFQAFGSLHGTAIMTPDGAVRARYYDSKLAVTECDSVTIAGDEIEFVWRQGQSENRRQRPVAFTDEMTKELARLHVAVIGVSGTGSLVCEQVARLGFGHVTMIDFDHIEKKNLNRIINSTLRDAEAKRLKVEAFADAIRSFRGEGVAKPVAANISTRDAVLAASQADILFCCVDTLEARHMADLIAAAFLIPLFDVGVVIPIRQGPVGPNIADVCGRIDYVRPGGPTLGDRGVYSPASLRAEYIQHHAPEAHSQEVKAGYIQGMTVEAPAVITLNMRAASACVNEFIARAYPFRIDPNANYARSVFSLAACEEDHFAELSFKANPFAMLGRGDQEPLLGLPALQSRSVETFA